MNGRPTIDAHFFTVRAKCEQLCIHDLFREIKAHVLLYHGFTSLHSQ